MDNANVNTDEQIGLFYKVLHPEVQKIKDEERYNMEMAKAYRYLCFLYLRIEDVLESKSSIDTALVYAEKSRNDTTHAYVYQAYADWHRDAGSIEKAHEYYYKAIDIFEEQGNELEISSAFLAIANSYGQMRDYEGVKSVVRRLQDIDDGNASKTFHYNLYSIQSYYYHLLYEEFSDTECYRDSSILYAKKGIYLAEKYGNELNKVEVPWSYYNLAVTYLNDFSPPLLDSISYYLDKIEACDLSYYDENAFREVMISVNDMKAWLYYHNGEYGAAEKKAQEVLELLGQQINPNMVIPEYSEIYRFLAMLYEETNKPLLALKYQKLFNENQSKRFKQEKMYALKELNTKYEVEKKESNIIELRKEQEYTQRIFLLSIIVLAALLFIIVLLFITSRLKRKGMEQRLYEAALIAEQRLEELEHQEKEKRKLQEEYDRLQDVAASSKDETKYEKELDLLKRKIQKEDSKTIISKVEKIVDSSVLDTATKQKYLKLLSEINAEKLQQTFSYSFERLTPMDMKYVVCFSIGMDIPHIATIFNVEPASVYTVRYRVKKKFKNDILLDFLI